MQTLQDTPPKGKTYLKHGKFIDFIPDEIFWREE